MKINTNKAINKKHRLVLLGQRVALRVFFAVGFVLSVLASSAANAACTMPAGKAGDQIYSRTYNVMQYCNGTLWINMGAAAGATPLLTPNNFCTANAAGTQIVCGTAAINLGSMVTGDLSVNNLAGGVNASASTFWRGDGTWASASELAAGTAAAPSLNFTTDPNTGLFSGGADILGFSTGGTERMRIDANGNVSFTGAAATTGTALDLSSKKTSILLPKGTTGEQPAGVLGMVRFNTTTNQMEIYQGTSPAWVSVLSTTSTGSIDLGINLGPTTTAANPARSGEPNTGLYSPASGTVGIATLGGERMRITSTGSVGIGTSSPAAALDVAGEAWMEVLRVTGTTTTTAGNMGVPAEGADGMVQFNSSNSLAGDVTFIWDNTNKNLGIGIAVPRSVLDLGGRTDAMIMPLGTTAQQPAAAVKGMLRYNATTDMVEVYQGASPTWVSIGSNFLGTSTAATSPSRSNDVTTGLFSPAAGTVAIASSGVEAMRVSATGSVGIGTKTPSATLDVNGPIKLGASAVVCSAPYAGLMRYTASNTIEFCNGTAWGSLGGGGSGPNALTFTDQTGISLSSTITSNALTLSGFTGAVAVTCGTGCTSVLKNGSAIGSSGIFASGDTLAITQVSSNAPATTTTASVMAGSLVSTPWSVTTKSDIYKSLLLHMDGANGGTTFTDSSGLGNTVVPQSVTTDTTTYKFGTASGYFNGSAYLAIPSSSAFDFGTGDFTIDLWVRPSAASGEIYNKRPSSTIMNVAIGIYSGNYFACIGGVKWNGSCTDSPFGAVVLNQWTHLALVRSGSTFYQFKDGVLGNSFTSSAAVTFDASSVSIGQNKVGFGTFTGYIDELRVSKGIARWTSNFIPPTAPY